MTPEDWDRYETKQYNKRSMRRAIVWSAVIVSFLILLFVTNHR
jgi:hypothetical protein